CRRSGLAGATTNAASPTKCPRAEATDTRSPLPLDAANSRASARRVPLRSARIRARSRLLGRRSSDEDDIQTSRHGSAYPHSVRRASHAANCFPPRRRDKDSLFAENGELWTARLQNARSPPVRAALRVKRSLPAVAAAAAEES